MTTLLRDRYTVGDVIGAGGAGRVHVATDRVLGRRVAVKVLDDRVARSADPAGRARFLAEARTAATIVHPNLVTVYDAGEESGELFLVMEYVEGVTLAELLARGAPLAVDQAVSIASQLLDALAAVHAHGTIHRDVKPANILVGDDGRVRLADFGIAKRLDEIGESVTATGTLVGSPGYLAPEQSAGLPLSPATDLFQAGVVLHEMLTGSRDLGVVPGPEVPATVASVVTRATDPDPSARYASAAEMRAALDTSVERPPHTLLMPLDPVTSVLSPAPSPDTRRGLLVTIAVALAVLVIALAGVATRGGGDELLPAATTVPAVSAVPAPPTTAAPAPTVALTVPAPAPVTAEPEPAARENGKDNNGKGKDKRDD